METRVQGPGAPLKTVVAIIIIVIIIIIIIIIISIIITFGGQRVKYGKY